MCVHFSRKYKMGMNARVNLILALGLWLMIFCVWLKWWYFLWLLLPHTHSALIRIQHSWQWHSQPETTNQPKHSPVSAFYFMTNRLSCWHNFSNSHKSLIFCLCLFCHRSFSSLFPTKFLASRLRRGPDDNVDVRECIRLKLCKFDGHCAECHHIHSMNTVHWTVHILKPFRQIIQIGGCMSIAISREFGLSFIESLGPFEWCFFYWFINTCECWACFCHFNSKKPLIYCAI